MWTLDVAGGTISSLHAAQTKGYVGFGLSKVRGTLMVNSDGFIGFVDAGGNLVLDDYFLGSKFACAGTSGVCKDENRVKKRSQQPYPRRHFLRGRWCYSLDHDPSS